MEEDTRSKLSLIIIGLAILIPILLMKPGIMDNGKEKSSYSGELFPSTWDNELWNRTWGGSGGDTGFSTCINDSFIYTCGMSYSFGAGDNDLLLVKWDTDGNQVWNRSFDDPGNDFGLSVCCNDSFVYTLGISYDLGAGGTDLLLVKWDVDGNQLWNRTWGGPFTDIGRSVCSDGSYVYTCGQTTSFGAGNGDLLLVKWDADGNQVWNRTWGGTEGDGGGSVCSNGSFIYTSGGTHSFGLGNGDLLLVKWDADGNQMWNRTWGGTNLDVGYSVCNNGSFVYTFGDTHSFGGGAWDMLLVKWDADGNQQWNRTWGDLNWNYGNSLCINGSFVYGCGETQVDLGIDSELVLVKWDASGNQLWNRTWGGAGDDFGRSVSTNGTFVYTCGETDSFGAGGDDLLLVKWDTNSIPQASIQANATSIISGQEILFTPDVSGGDGDLTWAWDFGDGSPGSGLEGSVSHTFASPVNTSFIVNLTVTDVYGDVNTSLIVINVEADLIPQVFINANITSIRSGQEISFTPTVSGGNEDLTWAWDFGDGSPGSAMEGNISHLFTSSISMSFVVNLTITDANGDTNSSTVVIDVEGVPQVSIEANDTSIRSGEEILFTPNVPPGDGDLNWSWDFGDGTPVNSTEGTVSHVFTTLDLIGHTTDFTVNLTVTDVDGDSNSSIVVITVIGTQHYENPTSSYYLEVLFITIMGCCIVMLVAVGVLRRRSDLRASLRS
ncbi:MAG: PKD domain-containing protein [Candidatus Hodarchaeota archaeon]